MYTFVDAAVVRAATETAFLSVQPWPDLTGSTDEHVAQVAATGLASNEFAAAVELASPALARRVQEICEGRLQQERQVGRAVLSILRYRLRATPFGLFVGVAPARIGSPRVAHFCEHHYGVGRVDTE